jgi:NAD-dependent DNA ligase
LDKVNTLPKAGNPSWAVAFKDADLNQDVLAVVERIEWNVSPHGHLKPVAIIRPVI